MTATVEDKIELLQTLTKVFDRFVESNFRTACDRNCSACCTYDVAATTLEAWVLLNALTEAGRDDLLARVREAAGGELFRPKVTTNMLAMACMTGQDPPLEQPPERIEPCPLLTESLCPQYQDRPFSCRGMFSLHRCQAGGEAEMPPELVTIVSICWQIVEHLDAGGLYGNVLELIVFLTNPKQKEKYLSGEQLKASGLPPTRPLPGLLVPPEHQDLVNRFLEELFSADCGGEKFRAKAGRMRNSPF